MSLYSITSQYHTKYCIYVILSRFILSVHVRSAHPSTITTCGARMITYLTYKTELFVYGCSVQILHGINYEKSKADRNSAASSEKSGYYLVTEQNSSSDKRFSAMLSHEVKGKYYRN